MSEKEKMQSEEMEDLLGYTKRLTAHLEYISYMVRHGISIGAQVECMAYKVPICGATICGTYWRPSTLGWSSNGLLNVGGQAEAFLDSPKITGTIPRISTKGWSGGQTLDGGDYFWFNNGAEERLPDRGGNWYDGGNAGVFDLNLSYSRAVASWYVGGRSAFVELPAES